MSAPSDSAHLIAKVVVPHLDDTDAEQLRQLVANTLTLPTVAQIREARLGLLAALVAGESGASDCPGLRTRTPAPQGARGALAGRDDADPRLRQLGRDGARGHAATPLGRPG